MTTNELQIFTVDAFTDEPFEGNPAAVCLLKVKDGKPILSDVLMQKIASEMNLSETVYIIDTEQSGFDTGDRFKIRWFTPTNEVPLCGHATVASAAVLFYQLNNSSNSITFDSASGPLITERVPPNGIKMNFPLNPPNQQDKDEIADLLKLLLPDTKIHSVHYSQTTKKLLLRMSDDCTRDDLECLKPDTTAMMKSETTGKVMGVIVTLKGTADNGCVRKSGEMYDFISRYFAPWNGIPEDPVTGSAHTVSGAYWSGILKKKSLFARQCSKRGGDVRIHIRDDGRVDLTGQSTIVMKGTFIIQ